MIRGIISTIKIKANISEGLNKEYLMSKYTIHIIMLPNGIAIRQNFVLW